MLREICSTFIIAALFCIFAVSPTAAHNWDKQAAFIKPYVIVLNVEYGHPYNETVFGACSAWVFDAQKGYAATAGHCVYDQTLKEKRKAFIYWDGEERYVEIAALSRYPEPDIAIIALPEFENLPALRQNKSPKVGQEVMLSGFTEVSAVLHKWGKISLVKKRIFIDTVAMRGMSGGPVTDSRNRVIGLTSTTAIAWGLTMVVPIEDIHALAKRAGLN